MISDEEKAKIKDDIVNKVNSVLEKNNESFRLDKVNVLNKNETVDIKSKKIRDSGMKFTAVSFNFEL